MKKRSFHQVSSKSWNKELCLKWIQSIKRTGNLPSDEGFFIYYSRFVEISFERNLKIIILVLLRLLNFVSTFLKNWTFQSISWLFVTKIYYYKNVSYVTMKRNISNPMEAIYLNVLVFAQNIQLQLMVTWFHLSMYLLFVINLSPFKLLKIESAVLRKTSLKHTDLQTILKKKLWHRCFPVIFKKVLRTSFLQHISGRCLLLKKIVFSF